MLYFFFCLTDVAGITDVKIEASETDSESAGLALTDDIIFQIYPFSAAVPAVLEARNKEQAAFIPQKSNLKKFRI